MHARAPYLQQTRSVTKRKFFGQDPHPLKEEFWAACHAADRLLKHEDDLVETLRPIDRRRIYVRYGMKSLTGFCVEILKLSRTQTQRIVTQVRRRNWDDPDGIASDNAAFAKLCEELNAARAHGCADRRALGATSFEDRAVRDPDETDPPEQKNPHEEQRDRRKRAVDFVRVEERFHESGVERLRQDERERCDNGRHEGRTPSHVRRGNEFIYRKQADEFEADQNQISIKRSDEAEILRTENPQNDGDRERAQEHQKPVDQKLTEDRSLTDESPDAVNRFFHVVEKFGRCDEETERTADTECARVDAFDGEADRS